MSKFLVSFKGAAEQWDEVTLSDGWVTCKNEDRTIYYPTHRITSIELFEDLPEPTEVRVSWDELERRSA